MKPNEIEVRIQQINQYQTDKGVKRYVQLLLYKTARTDAALLDETYGSMNWQNRYESIDGKLYCGIAVRRDDGEWIWKWNTGTESNMEAQKGEASDAMKRAGFCWGIGTELYSAPSITVFAPKATIKERQRGGYACYDRFSVRDISYDSNEDICKLVIVNESTGMDVFAWSAGQKAVPAPKAEKPKTQEKPKAILCKDCGAEIKGYEIDGVTFTVADHIKACRKHFGNDIVCVDCAKKRMKK